MKTDPSLLPTDWSGDVKFAHVGDVANSQKQIIGGSMDEIYVFPCAVSESDIKSIKTHCDRYGMEFFFIKIPNV